MLVKDLAKWVLRIFFLILILLILIVGIGGFIIDFIHHPIAGLITIGFVALIFFLAWLWVKLELK